MTDSKQGKIITFYSYKGGTGRSMAVANIAWILAANGKRVLVVDWDLEAPGLQRYFRPFLVDRELTSSPGVVDLITDFILEAITPLEKGEKLAADWFVPRTDIDPYVISLNWKFPAPGQLDFIPAGRQGPDYAQRFGAINWQKFYDVLGGGAFIEQLKINLRSQYDYILVDSRTGVSDTSGICTIQLPDTLVVCFTYNNQSIEGAASITQHVYEQRTAQDSHSSLTSQQTKGSSSADGFYRSPYRFKVFPVPMRVDQSEKDKLGIRRSYARRKFDPFLDRKTIVDRRAFWGAVSVPYVPYFSYEEILAAFKDDPTDPNTCLAAFTRIATEITEKDVTGYVPLIEPRDRDAVLQEFANVPTPELIATGSSGDGRVVGEGSFHVSPPVSAGAGSADAAETPLETTLRRAEATLRSLNEEERQQARLLWMRLVRIPRPGENIENSKVRVPLSELGDERTAVIQKFANAGVVIVSKDDRTGEPTVEVKEEELLRSWPTLDRWIQEDRDLMLWRQDLQFSVAHWEERGRGWRNLLAGRRLRAASKWYKTHRQYFSDKEAAYIKASSRAALIVTVGGIAIVAAMIVAFYLYDKVSNKSGMAESIASNAESQIESAKRGAQLSADQYQLGLLLATEAQQLAPTAKAEDLLKTELTPLPRRVGSADIKSNVLDLALSPSGSQVLSVTGTPRLGVQAAPDSATAQLTDVTNGQVILRVSIKQGARRFHTSRDARYLAFYLSEGNTYEVDVIEAATGRTVITVNHGGAVNDISFSPDGNYLATASDDKIARVVNLTAPGGVRSFDVTYTNAVRAVTFSGDSQHLAVLTDNSKVQVLRNIPSAERFADYRGLTLPAVASVIALSHNGRYLATAYRIESTKLWDVETEQLLKKYEAGGILYVAFTPDSKFLMGAAMQNMNVWNLSVDSQNTSIPYEAFDGVYLTIDATYFATVKDTVARIWQYDGTAYKQTTYLVNNSNLLRLKFANPNFIVTADANNVVAVWKLGDPLSDNLRNEACARLTRNMTIDEWNQHVASYLGAYRKTCSELP